MKEAVADGPAIKKLRQESATFLNYTLLLGLSLWSSGMYTDAYKKVAGNS
jgi:hypothetical protein